MKLETYDEMGRPVSLDLTLDELMLLDLLGDARKLVLHFIVPRVTVESPGIEEIVIKRYDVELSSVSHKHIIVTIKVIRTYAGISLRDSKNVVDAILDDGVTVVVGKDMEYRRALDFVAELRSVGALADWRVAE